MKLTTAFFTGIAAAALTLGATLALAPASSAAICNDGSLSMSSGRGTCSWHGGIMGGGSSRNSGGYGSNSFGSGSNSFGLGSGSKSYGLGSGSNSFGLGSGSKSYGLGSGSSLNGFGSSGNSFGSNLYNW